MRHRFVFPIVSALILLVVTLIAVEVLLRFAGVSPKRIASVDATQFESVPGIWKPDQQLISREIASLPYAVSINTLGYRGRNFPVTKPPGQFRILMVGDSLTFGNFVDDDMTLPSRLEAHMASACPQVPVLVINAGVSGSTITTQVEMIERGMELDPDLIVLAFHENDLEDLRTPLWEIMSRNRAAKSQFPMRIAWPVLRNTATWSFALHVRAWWTNRSRVAGGPGEQQSADLAPLKSEYQAAFVALRNRLRERSLPLLFLGYPGHWTVKGTEPFGINAWAVQLARSLDVQTVDLSIPLRIGLAGSNAAKPEPRKIDRGYLLPHDGHPSALGHDLAGGAVARAVLERAPFSTVCGAQATVSKGGGQ